MKKTKIEWTENTWNPSIGCNKVSAGCKNCYAEVMAKRLKYMGNKDYENGFEFKILPNRLSEPCSIKKPTLFFVNSMSDLFHEKMPFEYIEKIFEVIKETPIHNYQILTKRADIMYKYIQGKREIPNNIWLGVSVESKKVLDRINYLRDIEFNNIKFLSCEPLLEDLGDLNLNGIDWVIVGGESGFNARPMNKEWVLNVKNDCERQNVKFFFKQWGAYGEDGVRRNKKINGNILDNEIYIQIPEFRIKK